MASIDKEPSERKRKADALLSSGEGEGTTEDMNSQGDGGGEINDSGGESFVPLDASVENSDVVTATAAEDEDDEETQDKHKFQFRQRVYARDEESGLLYEATVRKVIFGTHWQKQIKIKATTSEEEVNEFLSQEPEATYFYFVHYTGWNVKWDRWVAEKDLHEPTESTRSFAKRLQAEVSRIKKEESKNGRKRSINVATILENRMAQLQREHRLEERRKELAARGEEMNQEEEAKLLNPDSTTAAPKNKWTKANVKKEIGLRERHLQGRRNQKSSELLVLPFTLKKIMVEEWEIVTQCGMLADLPATVTVRQALNKYLASKLETLREGETQIEVEKSPAVDASGGEMTEAERGWREMVDGVCLFFDQAIPDRLLYQHEVLQHDALQIMSDDADNATSLRNCEVYGCEFLLRLFIRLPAILVEELSEKEYMPIMAKLNDLVRFLQKHQSSLFSQRYRRLNETELALQNKKSSA